MNRVELIWPFFKGCYKVHCHCRNHARQIALWSGCVRHAVYCYPDGHVEEDVVIPVRHLRRVKLLIRGSTEPETSENGLVVTQ